MAEPIKLGIQPQEKAISLRADASAAYNQIGRIEREFRKAFNIKGAPQKSGNDKGKITARVRKVVSRAVAHTIADTFQELLVETPAFTGWLKSNWKLAQGQLPDLTVLPKAAKKYAGPPPPILADDVNGFKKQFLYNRTNYATDAALGYNPYNAENKIVSGGGADWFLNVGQRFSAGVIFYSSLSKALAEN